MIISICLSILIQSETKIVLNKCLHYLVRASHDSGMFGTIFLFHEWYNSVMRVIKLNHNQAITNSPFVTTHFDLITLCVLVSVVYTGTLQLLYTLTVM